MKKMLKAELWKALHNRLFYLAVLAGVAISTANIIRNAGNISQFDEYMQSLIDNKVFNISYSPLGYSLFVQWLPIARTSLCHSIISFIWPILAAMPFGWSYCSERRSGVYNQFVINSNRRVYFLCKYLATFISGGLAIMVPVAFDLLINALICPYVIPSAIIPINIISDGWFLSEMYFSRPWVYGLLWCGVEFVLGGTTACCCFLVGAKPRLRIMTILTPFIILIIWDAVYLVISGAFSLYVELSPLAMFAAATPRPNPEWAVGSVLFVLWVCSFCIGYWQVVKHEIL